MLSAAFMAAQATSWALIPARYCASFGQDDQLCNAINRAYKTFIGGTEGVSYISSGTTSGNTLKIRAYDNNLGTGTYVDFVTLTSGNTPTMTMSGIGSSTFSEVIVSDAAGVKITGDGDGAITFLGLGDGTDEDLTFNLDDTSNTVTVSSSTSVATVNFSGMDLQEGGVDVISNDEMDASSELRAIMDDETGTGVLTFATAPTFTTSISVGSAGVKLSDDGDGAITFLSLGNGSGGLEDLTLNLDDTSNRCVITSSTGVTELAFGGITLVTESVASVVGGTLTLASTANTADLASQAGMDIFVAASDATAGTTTAGAAAGGSVDISAGDAKQFTSGNANGGDVRINVGDGVGTGASGYIVLNGIVKTDSLATGSPTGIQITDDSDGAWTWKGLGDGADEDMTWNLDDTADTITLSSTTGVTTLDTGTIGITTQGTVTATSVAAGSITTTAGITAGANITGLIHFMPFMFNGTINTDNTIEDTCEAIGTWMGALVDDMYDIGTWAGSAAHLTPAIDAARYKITTDGTAGSIAFTCDGSATDGDYAARTMASVDWTQITNVAAWVYADVAIDAGDVLLYSFDGAGATTINETSIGAVAATTWTYVSLDVSGWTKGDIEAIGFSVSAAGAAKAFQLNADHLEAYVTTVADDHFDAVVSATTRKVGTSSISITCDGAATDGDVVAFNNASADFTNVDRVGFWIYSDQTIATGDVLLYGFDGAAGTTINETNIGAAGSSAWVYKTIDISAWAAKGDIDYLGFSLSAAGAAKAFTFYIDQMISWDATNSTALVAAPLIGGIVNGYQFGDLAANDHTVVSLGVENTDYVIAYDSTSKAFIPIVADLSGKICFLNYAY